MKPLSIFLFAAMMSAAVPALFGGEPPLSDSVPLKFADAARLAVESSEDLRNTAAALKLRERAWILGLRAYLPKLSISISENDRLQETGADSFIKNYGINMDQLLWDGGRTLMSRKLERLELGFSHSQLERMASDAAESALGMYRNVILSRAVLKIREAALESLSEQRRILKEETELGLALAADLAEADLALADTKIEIQSLYADLEELEHQFADVLGLAKLPPLEEKVDIGRGAFPPRPEAARSLAQERNPELAEARLSIVRKQDELKLASRSWIPSLRLVGGFALTGPDYPLNRCNWTLGISIEFSDPWFQNSFGFQAGWEPPYDRTAQLQNTFSPLPDPAAGLDRHQAKLALGLEREKYSRSFERVGRTAVLAVEKYAIADRKRSLAVEALALAGERCRLEEFRLSLGQITRIELMEELVEYSKKEIAAAEAAAALLEAERELERLLDLKPGELADFTAGNKTYRGES